MTTYAPPKPAKMSVSRRLSALEKSAVIVANLQPAQAALVLRGLRTADLRRFSQALQKVRDLHDDAVRDVIRDFLLALNNSAAIDGGIAQARAMLGAVLDADVVDRVLAEVGVPKLNLWAFIASMSADEMVDMLGEEHPQTIGWVLGRVAPDQARNVLGKLPKTLAQQAVLGMSGSQKISSDTVKVIEAALTRRLLSKD